MGFDFEGKRTFLYADLFKLDENLDNNRGAIMSQWMGPSSSHSSACDSSSSGFDSELDSSESEDGDFTAELSRQMAECMLHEEEEDERNSATHFRKSPAFKGGPNSNRPVLDHANRIPCIELKSQSQVGVARGRRVNGAELTRQMQTRKPEQNYGRYRDGDWRSGSGRNGHSGSGMRAIFLGGSGSRIRSTGTGVFLPRVTNTDPVEPKKKSGLSTVLIPTRVLEALELHFTKLSDSEGSPVRSFSYSSPRGEWMRSKGQENIHMKMEMEAANKIDEMQILPKEWTY